MITKAKQLARSNLERLNDYNPLYREANRLQRLERRARPVPVIVTPNHAADALEWIKRAQNATGTGGVAWGYTARRPARSNAPLGWVAPYPETTGYLIPTMFRYADLTGDKDSEERAFRMGDWELSIQLDDGGFQGGTLGAQPVSSSTFVTGQVLFGLVAIIRRTQQSRYVDAAMRAAQFLITCLDDRGRFKTGYSYFCDPGPKAYEARTGLALAELGVVCGDRRYLEAASRIADYTLSCQQPNGWFKENDLDDHACPLTHTIGYALEGLHGIGQILGRDDCLDAVDQTLSQITRLAREDGFLAGRWFQDWTPAANWACLTGNAQIAGVCLRSHLQRPSPALAEVGRRLLGFVGFTQELRGEIPGTAGGIRGSYPFSGLYCQWSCPNWAAKFFADSVMDCLSLPSSPH